MGRCFVGVSICYIKTDHTPWETMTRKSTTTLPPMAAPRTVQYALGEGTLEYLGRTGIFCDHRALGLLREELLRVSGGRDARTILTRVGYATGFCIGEGVRSEFPSLPFQEMLQKGFKRAADQGIGLQVAEPEQGTGLVVLQSWEARQHLLRIGPAKEPLC